MKKKIFAFVFVLLAISIFTLNSFALSPPATYYSDTALYSNANGVNVTANDQEAIYKKIDAMQKLGYFQFGKFFVVGRTGSQTRLYVTDDARATLTTDDSNLTITTNGTYVVIYNITPTRFVYYGRQSSNQVIPMSNVAVYSVAGLVVKNDSFVPGTLTSSAFVSNAQAWATYADKVLNYETTLENTQSSALAQGQQIGYQQGYTAGESAGYTTGYDAGRTYERAIADEELREASEAYDDLFQRYESAYDDGFAAGVASVPPGSGSDRVVTATVNFYNGDLQLVPMVLVTNGTDLRFWEKEYLGQAFQEGYVIYNYQYDVLQSQLQSGSSIRFKIPDNVLQAFPNLTWPVVTVAESDPLLARLEVWLYSDSYDAGYQSGLQDGDMILDGIAGIATAPVDGLRAALDFEIFGLNVGAVAIGCVAVALILIAWRFIRKIIPV